MKASCPGERAVPVPGERERPMVLETGYPRALCSHCGRTASSSRVTRWRRLRPARF